MKLITFIAILFTLNSFSQSKFKTETEYSHVASTLENTGTPQTMYTVTMISLKPLKINVNALLPINGRMLDMDQNYPADLPEMERKGWPALISNLQVTNLSGKEIRVTALGNKGWKLVDSINSILNLNYDIDYSILAASGWSSYLESAFVDENNALVVGRSVFITTNKVNEIKVKFKSLNNWIPIAPWENNKSEKQLFNVKSIHDLIDNMLIFTSTKPSIISTSGFKMQVVTMGHWRPLNQLVDETLKTIITKEVGLMHYREKEIYTVILLPISDKGGNAFRQSFVYCYNDPNPENKIVWGNTLAHEIFHYWNYSILRGASYADSQWFQEGFTEYIANLTMVTGKVMDSSAFLNKLSEHINNYRKLTTTIENFGTRKGPPLYSAGALVAFMWDIKIRNASKGKMTIGNFFQNLMKQTNMGNRKYTWMDIKAALQNTVNSNWEECYQSYIKGRDRLPLEIIFPLAGLRIYKLTDGFEKVSFDPTSSMEARNLIRKLMGI